MWTLITILHVVACLFLILVVLLQAGKGGGLGVNMGASTSAAVFGGRGAGSFLEKLTAGTAIFFVLTSMSLAWNSSRVDSARLKREADAAQKAAAEKSAADKAKTALPPAPTIPASLPPTTPAPTAPGGGLKLAPPGGLQLSPPGEKLHLTPPSPAPTPAPAPAPAPAKH